jgi:ribosomal-protein-alanine N-acetyltransferase
MYLTPQPELETKRLLLRALKPEDAGDLFEMRRDASTHQFTDTLPEHRVEETENYIAKMDAGIAQKKWYVWGLMLRETGKIIGTFSLWQFDAESLTAEIGCTLHPIYRGVVMRFAHQQLHLTSVEAYTEQQNLSARQMLKKSGFSEVDHLDELGTQRNKIFHMLIYKKTLSGV